MLHLRELGVIEPGALTAAGVSWGEVLDAWAVSERRARFRERLRDQDGVDPDEVILSPARAKQRGLTSTVTFPRGNLAPDGAVIKSTAIDPAVVGRDGVFRHDGPARVFTSEKAAIAAIKNGRVQAGDVLVLAGVGPLGTGMEETYQVTSALKHLPFGRSVALLTDGRFSASPPGRAWDTSVPRRSPAGHSDGSATAIASAWSSIVGGWRQRGLRRRGGPPTSPSRGGGAGRTARPIRSWPRRRGCRMTPGFGPRCSNWAAGRGEGASTTSKRSVRRWVNADGRRPASRARLPHGAPWP